MFSSPRLIKVILVFPMLVWAFAVHAQFTLNLVPNPQLSNFTSCPNTISQTTLCTGWFPAGDGTSDFFHTCDPMGPPINFGGGFGTNMPHSLPGMLGFYTYNGGFTGPGMDYREYVACQLLAPLLPGYTYSVSYWMASVNGLGKGYYSSNMGVLFSDTICHQASAGGFWGFNTLTINALPQLEDPTIATNMGWVQKTYTLTPSAGSNWQYMTVGNFRTNGLTSVSPTPLFANGGTWGSAYYFVDDFEVTIIVPTLTLSAVTASVSCFGGSDGSATVSASGSSGPYKYIWSNGDSTQTASNLAAGNYTVMVMDSIYANGTGTLAVTISEPSALVAGLSQASNPKCVGDTVTLVHSVSGGTPPYSLQWSTGATTPSVTVIALAQLSTYSLSVTDAHGCADTVALTVFPPPAQPVASFSLSAQCSDTIQFNNTSLNMQSAQWWYGDGTSGNSNVHIYPASGNYSITLVVTSPQGCNDTLSQVVNLDLTQAVAAFSYSLIPCSDSVAFTNNSTGASHYQWNFGDGSSDTLIHPVHHYLAGPAPYSVVLMADPGTVCQGQTLATVYVNPVLPVAAFSTHSAPCSAVTTFSNTSSNALLYDWNYGDGNSNTLYQGMNTYTSAGTYTVSLIASDAMGCKDTVRQSVTIYMPVVASFTYAIIPCSNDVAFTNSSSNATLFGWSFGDGTNSTLPNPTHTYTSAGPYTVTLVANPGQLCNHTTQVIVPPLPALPLADFAYALSTYDDQVHFQNLSTGATQAHWSFGDNSADAYSWEALHAYFSTDTNQFMVCLNIWNAQGCEDSICKPVIVIPELILYVPDAFTPNGDHINDRFFAKGVGIAEFKMSIFDRWGQSIFYSENMTQGWDGHYKGSEAPQDVYVWTIEAKDGKGKSYTRTGHVSLVR